ncbi:MAG: methylated-DNA--[protein]-cysteine S-methyltransferase [Vicinamibacterales bacterium]
MTADAFSARVLQLVSRIPVGRVSTYGDLAERAGRPRAARAVGRILASATRAGLPYHRVVASGGLVGGYGSGTAMKAALLAAEGAVVRRGRVVNFAARRWRP